MASHTTAFLSITAWSYSSPEQRERGNSIEIGLFAESLLYYDNVVIEIIESNHFDEFVMWFVRQDQLATLLEMLSDGTISFQGYNYLLTPFHGAKDNIPIPGVTRLGTADEHGNARCVPLAYAFCEEFSNKYNYEYFLNRFRSLIHDRFTVCEPSEFESGLIDARNDFSDPRRKSLIVQAFIDKLYEMRSLGRPPEVKVETGQATSHGLIDIGLIGPLKQTTVNINLKGLQESCGPALKFDFSIALLAQASCNRAIDSARRLGTDLFLGEPMSVLVGDKLYEAARSIRLEKNLQELKERVAFPDVRDLVNRGHIKLEHILIWRKKAERFREWLQTESERDRDAIFAYHNEIGRDIGFGRGAKWLLKLFGILSAPAVGGIVGAAVDHVQGRPPGQNTYLGLTAGALVSSKVEKLTDPPPWKPVVFGDWLRGRIENLLDERERDASDRKPGITPIGDIETKLRETATEESKQSLDRKHH